MSKTVINSRWHQLSEEVITGMKEWRMQHPKATLAEIESALDERLAYLRARMLQDVALASASVDWSKSKQRPKCVDCGEELVSSGTRRRRLQTQGRQEITLERTYGVCPACSSGNFPPG